MSAVVGSFKLLRERLEKSQASNPGISHIGLKWMFSRDSPFNETRVGTGRDTSSRTLKYPFYLLKYTFFGLTCPSVVYFNCFRQIESCLQQRTQLFLGAAPSDMGKHGQHATTEGRNIGQEGQTGRAQAAEGTSNQRGFCDETEYRESK